MIYKTEITRVLEFDAGHRIFNHQGRCAHLHGHRYRLEVTVAGQVVPDQDQPDYGMIIDFQTIQKLTLNHLVDHWDHAFLVDRDDPVLALLQKMPNHRTVVIDCPPTVENLARIAFSRLKEVYATHCDHRVVLCHIRLYETPNCWADVWA